MQRSKLKQILFDYTGVLIILGIIGLPLAVMLGAYIWDEGYLGFYWEEQDSIYDPQLKVFRCLTANGELTEDLEPPCFVLTSRRQKAMKRHQKACEENGGTPADCRQEAVRWVMSKRPTH